MKPRTVQLLPSRLTQWYTSSNSCQTHAVLTKDICNSFSILNYNEQFDVEVTLKDLYSGVDGSNSGWITGLPDRHI